MGGDAAVIRSEREFMDALRVLKARSGLSYRDIAMRMSRVAPRQAMAKSTLATLFARDTLPRRPGQLKAVVGVLAGELAEPADLATRYLAAWDRLMAARSAVRGGTTDPGRWPERASPPVVPPVVTRSLPVPPQAPYPARPNYQPAYREHFAPARIDTRSDYEKAGGFFPLLVGCTILSVITWLPFTGSGISFWWIWLGWCGPLFLLSPLTLLNRGSRASRQPELPADFVRSEYRRPTDQLPIRY